MQDKIIKRILAQANVPELMEVLLKRHFSH